MDINTNINENNNETKYETLRDVESVKVKTEIVSEDYLPVNEYKTLCNSIVDNQFINNINDFNIKKEHVEDDVENRISDITFRQDCSSQIKDEYNEEELSISENEVDKFVNNSEVDEKVNIIEMNCVPEDDPLKEGNKTKQCLTMSNSSINNKQAKMKLCQFCHKSFTAKHSLDDHLLKKHKNKIESDLKQFITSKIHRCKVCSYQTTMKNLMQDHSLKHTNEKTYKTCKFCNKRFVKKMSLDDHMLKQHKQKIKGKLKSLITTKMHTCTICNTYETTSKGNLYRHVNLIHNKEQVKCQFCREPFMYKQLLDRHILQNHKEIHTIVAKNIVTLMKQRLNRVLISSSMTETKS